MAEMIKIEDKIKELSELILNSEEYRKYMEAREKLHQDLQLEKRVNEYKKTVFDIKNRSAILSTEQLKNEMAEYMDVRRNAIAQSYLNSEQIICRKIHDIQIQLVDPLDIDIDFL